jgi:hypothetical protein
VRREREREENVTTIGNMVVVTALMAYARP